MMSLGNEQIKNGTQYNKTDKRQPELAAIYSNTLILSHYSGKSKVFKTCLKDLRIGAIQQLKKSRQHDRKGGAQHLVPIT